MTCDGLPDPGSLSDMNTFLFLWPLTDKEASMNTIEDKCRVITHVSKQNNSVNRSITFMINFNLSAIEQNRSNYSLLHDRLEGIRDRMRIGEWISRKSFFFSNDCHFYFPTPQIATKLRIELQRWIDLACYRLLRNIEANMIREDMKTTRYVRATNKAVCCVWAPIPLPIGLKRQGGDIERSSLTAHGYPSDFAAPIYRYFILHYNFYITFF